METTTIGRRTAIALAALFAAAIVIPALDQLVVETRRTGQWRALSLFRQVPSHDSLRRFEEELARDSDLAARARTAYQTALTRGFRAGNEKIVVGEDGFLFFRKEVDLATGPGFLTRRSPSKRGTEREERRTSDPVAAIVNYHRQLAARGIRLVFVPLPSKPAVYPEKVWAGYPVGAGPACNRDREAFAARLAATGVDVIDPTDDLWKAKGEGELFLRLDTHWTPRGMEIVAGRIAERVRSIVGPPRETYASARRAVRHDGDLMRMIEVLPGSGLFPAQEVEISTVEGKGGDDAPVLLLGDSFTNVYSRRELEWGEGAGLGERLMARLGVPVQVLALNGGGATSVRQWLSRRPSALQSKKVVVWACSSRDLADEAVSWEVVPLPEVLP